MKIDSAIKNFTERYDREALEAIDRISKERGLVVRQNTIAGIDLEEGINNFIEFVTGYSQHKIDSVGKESELSQDVILEKTEQFIRNKLFIETPLLYSEFPDFINGYFDGIESVISVVEEVKENMSDADVDLESIGLVNEFADMFMDTLEESFTPIMETMLKASGYYTRKNIFNPSKEKKQTPVFL